MTRIDADPIPVPTRNTMIEAKFGDAILPYSNLTDADIAYLSTPLPRTAETITDYEPATLDDPKTAISTTVKFGGERNLGAEFRISLQPFDPKYFDVLYELFMKENDLDTPLHVPFGLEWGLRVLPDGTNEIQNSPVLMFASPRTLPDGFYDDPESNIVRGVSFGVHLAEKLYTWEPNRSMEDFYNGVLKTDEDAENRPHSNMFVLQPDQLGLLRGMELTGEIEPDWLNRTSLE